MHLQLDHMLPHWNFLRKPASDFGWDWGPAFAPSGIYGGVQLKAYSAAHMTGLPPSLAQIGVSGFAGNLKAAVMPACQACCLVVCITPPGATMQHTMQCSRPGRCKGKCWWTGLS